MSPTRTEPSLRIITGIVSIGQAQLRAGYDSTEPDRMFNEEISRLGRGTPGRRRIPARLGSTRSVTSTMLRVFDGVVLYVDNTPSETVHELSALFEPHATPLAVRLSLALVDHVEEERMLAGFSSAIAAVVCITVAAAALEMKPLLKQYVLRKLNILPGPVRVAYNHLWLRRRKLEAVIWGLGGDPTILPNPTTADGKLDVIAFCKGSGIPISPRSKDRPRHMTFERKPSLLRNVTYPPADQEKFGGASHVDSDSNSNQISCEKSCGSWESLSSNDPTEPDNANGELVGLGISQSDEWIRNVARPALKVA